MKLCSGPCGRRLPLDAFHRDPTKSDGRMSRCRDCRAAAERDRRRQRSGERVAAALADDDPRARRRKARAAGALTPAADPQAPARAARIVELAEDALRRRLRRSAAKEG